MSTPGAEGRIWHAQFACLAAVLVLLVACSEVVESQRLAFNGAAPPDRTLCASALGSYSLPKAHLHVKVEQGVTPPELVALNGAPVEVVRRPDPSLVFCLDHVSSAFTADKITIKKWADAETKGKDGDARPASSFLGAVVVNSTDQAVYIIKTLLRSLFVLVTRDAQFPERAGKPTTQTVADLEFDPFDSRESTAANERLRELGFCLVLEGYTYDTSRFSIDQYCSAPERVGGQASRITKAYERATMQPDDPFKPGLFYRPRHPYRLAIFRKSDPTGRGRWHLAQTMTVELENLSPVLSLDIRRAAFGARTASFVFNEGTLLTACVSKTSEIEGFVEIPFEISRSIVAVPASIIQVRIDQFQGQTALIKAQEDLFQVQQAHLAALNTGKFTSPGGQKEFKAPELKLVYLSMPKDLSPRDEAPPIGSDLFGIDLSKACAGTT